MDERQRRIGLNEALFRQINDRMDDLNAVFSAITDTIEVVCECGNAGCIDRIVLPTNEYASLRSEPTHFAVLPGHGEPEVEFVVADRGHYQVVEKRPGGPAELAEATAPRAGR